MSLRTTVRRALIKSSATTSTPKRRQRRNMNNPYVPDHQASEMSCFPSRDLPKVLYTGDKKYEAGYILQREPVITPEVHPVEQEFKKLVDAEHKKYPRSSEGGNLSMAVKKKYPDAYKAVSGSSLPYWREPKYVQQELTILRTLEIPKRLTPLDIEDTTNRHTLARRLQERLFLIVQDEEGVWRVPTEKRKQGECLKGTINRVIAAHHKGSIETHSLSHAPASHVDTDEGGIYFFPVYYLTGMPRFPIDGSSDHAWVTRHELREYSFPSLEYKRAVYNACHDDWMPFNVPIFEN